MENVPDFIAINEKPTESSNLNLLDYLSWNYNYLEEVACARRRTNWATLKTSIVKAVQQIPLNTICESIDDWPRRL